MAAIPIIGALAEGFKSIVAHYFPDKNIQEQQEIAKDLAIVAQQQQLLLGQLDINKIEAASSNLFVAGWRPSIGWVCASAYAYSYVLQPFLTFVMAAIGHPVTDLPALNMDAMMPVLGGILGLGYLRTQEKIKGIKK